MTRHFIEIRSISDWQSRLGNPDRHWKRGASAMELAVEWTLARETSRGLPAGVAALLDTRDELAGATVEFAIPELRTPLPGGSGPSQTDLWALLRNSRGAIALSIEAKAEEPFAETVDRWLHGVRRDRQPSRGRLERLQFLARRLGLDQTTLGDLRYQLLHRAAAALIEGERSGAMSAAVVVQRFASNPADPTPSWIDFREFASRLRAQVRPGFVARADVPGNIPLYLAWLDCKVASDEHILAAMLGARARAREGRVPQRNAFEALCALAQRESWCWRLGCTTCGCVHFRHALRELARGRHPDDTRWFVRNGATTSALRTRLGSEPRFPFPISLQQKIAAVASTAKIGAIASRDNFPDWLGYLGIVLNFCRDADRETGCLTEAWAPQLWALLTDGSDVKRRLMSKLETRGRLSLADLEAVEEALQTIR